MRAFGAPAEIVARVEKPAARKAKRVRVLACNWQSVEIFRRCQQTVAGMSGVCTGFAAQEVRAALELLGISRRRWPSLFDDVLYMGSVAANEINRKTSPAMPEESAVEPT